jgi:hypothetical protein
MNKFLAVVVAPFFGVIMLAMGAYQLYQQMRFDARSEAVQGTVLTIEFDKGSRPSSGPKSTKVAYQFTTRDGHTVQGLDSVSAETGKRLRQGGPVAIEYLEDDPSINQIHEVAEEWLYFVWICIGAGLIAINPLWRRWADPKRAPGQTAPRDRDSRVDTTTLPCR